MPNLLLPTLISCDESGYTGNNLLNAGQRFFAYASHDLSLSDAGRLITQVRRDHPVQMPELKAQKLLRSPRGRALIVDVLNAMQGRYIVSLYDKRVSLAGKLFEYLFEPVLQKNNMIFYAHNTHRFVAMFFFMLMREESIERLAGEFESFVRSLDPSDAPSFFGLESGANPLIDQILRFVRGYNVTIAREMKGLGRTESGRWVLDLTASAVFSHLGAWGERHPLLEVACDDSKPLRAMEGLWDVMINRAEQSEIEMLGKKRRLTWNMSKPVSFVSSRDHAGVQLADLLAGVTAALPQAGEELAGFAQLVEPHMHEDCIFPDFDAIDLDGDQAPVNWFILEELATRADRGADPLDGIEAMFEVAKRSLPAFRQHLSST